MNRNCISQKTCLSRYQSSGLKPDCETKLAEDYVVTLWVTSIFACEADIQQNPRSATRPPLFMLGLNLQLILTWGPNLCIQIHTYTYINKYIDIHIDIDIDML